MKNELHRKVVIVTGCSSGLGLALCQYLEKMDKYFVVATARTQSIEKLRNTFHASDNLMILELDVTNTTQVRNVIDQVVKRWGRVDALINNAGICYRGVVEHMDNDAELSQIQTNYLGPMNIIRSVLPVMREQRSGKIINISSVSGMVSMPTMASYSASKHALEGASEALWYEARPYGIHVTIVQPGFIRSNSFEHVKIPKKAELSNKLKGPHSEYYYSMTPLIERLMRFSFTSPEKISVKIEKCISNPSPPLRIQVTIDAMLFQFLRKFLPSSLFHKIMFKFLPGSINWGLKDKSASRLAFRKRQLTNVS